MFNRVIVPVDGSDHSWRAVEVAAVLATQCVADLELLQVVDHPDDVGAVEDSIARRLGRIDLRGRIPIVTARPVQTSVAVTVADQVRSVLGSVVVISSTGRGRAEALVGSVAEELLAEMYGPVVVVGPLATADRPHFGGQLVVPVDGSPSAESVLGLAAAWGIALGARPWIVEVIPPGAHGPADTLESSYPAGVARRLAELSHHAVDFEVLHAAQPARAIAQFAGDLDASLIVASTHGRSGLARLALGSGAMDIVRQAPCPVVLCRPPQLPRVVAAEQFVMPVRPPPPKSRRGQPTPGPRARLAPPLNVSIDVASPRVQATVADLAARLGVDEAAVDIVEARAVTWPDASYGCPQPGMMYVQRPVDGALVILAHAGRRYEYHGGTPLRLCEQPHPPVGG